MNKSALQDIQQALNAIRSEIERVDDETKWAALEMMLGTSSSVVALAKKMAKPETKTVTRTVAVPKTKLVKQQPQQQTLTPSDVGLGRMDIMGLPIGPKLTVASIPDGGLASGQASFQGSPPGQHLNLQPSGTREEKEVQQGQAMEALNESL